MGDKRNGRQLAQEISSTLNSYGHDSTIAECVTAMRRDHRTLQQTFTKLCVEWFRSLAQDESEGHFDGRNEESCKLAKLVVELGEDKLALPFI